MIQRYHNGFVLMQVVNNGQNQLPKGAVRGGTSTQDGKVIVCVTATPRHPSVTNQAPPLVAGP